MLSERNAELLTAYVDGELDPRERQAVDSLLVSSGEARTFLERLQADSKELHKLPSRKAPDTLADAVMSTVWETPQPKRREPIATPPAVTIPPNKPLPRWLGLVIAIIVLLAVVAGTFFLVGALLSQPAQSRQPEDGPENLDTFAKNIHEVAAVQLTEIAADGEIGVLLDLIHIQEETVKKRLQMELKKEPGFWFDVPCGNSKRAVERWTDAFKSVGISVIEDSQVKASLGKKFAKPRFYLYADNLSYEDVGQIFQTIGMAEQKAPAGRSVDRVIMTRITPDKRGQVAKALGVSPKQIDPAKGLELPPLVEYSKKQESDLELASNTSPSRTAILFALNGESKTSQSQEIKSFLESRKGFNKNAVQIVVSIYEQGPRPGAFGPPPPRFGQSGMASAKSKGPPPPFFSPKGKGKVGPSQFSKKGGGV